MGFPIRISADQSSFAAPRGFSQRSTSFIASQRQGIHQMPLVHLIALIINAHSALGVRRSLGSEPEAHGTLTRKTSLQDRTDDFLRSSNKPTKHRTKDPCGSLVPCRECALIEACGLKQCSERPSLHDVRNHAPAAVPASLWLSRVHSANGRELMCLDEPPRLVEPDGIEPTTSCLQSRRSPS